MSKELKEPFARRALNKSYYVCPLHIFYGGWVGIWKKNVLLWLIRLWRKKNQKEFLLCSFVADFGHRNKSPIYHKCHKIVHFCLLIECLRVFCQTAKNALSAKKWDSTLANEVFTVQNCISVKDSFSERLL